MSAWNSIRTKCRAFSESATGKSGVVVFCKVKIFGVMAMTRVSRFGFASTIGILLSVFAGFCAAKDVGFRGLLADSAVAGTELKVMWQHNLPLRDGETLERLVVFGSRIYVLSSRNYLSCLDRNDGRVVFSSFIGPAGLPVAGLVPYQDGLVSVIGNKLVEINPEFGTKQSSMNVVYGITCPAVRNDSYFYVAGGDKRIHALRAEDKVQVFQVAAQNNSGIVSVIADNDFVVFGTDAGNVICILPDRPRRLWQFDVPGKIGGDLVRDGEWLFLASEDTRVYKLDIFKGDLEWSYQTEAILDAPPQVGGSVVYQYVQDVGLTALGKDSGSFLWQVSGGIGLASESGDKAYVITKAGTLVAMDNARRRQLYAVGLGGASRYATNTADSKIYVADEAGRLACLQPAE